MWSDSETNYSETNDLSKGNKRESAYVRLRQSYLDPATAAPSGQHAHVYTIAIENCHPLWQTHA